VECIGGVECNDIVFVFQFVWFGVVTRSRALITFFQTCDDFELLTAERGL
jgi:hypothetical protein